MVMFGDILPFLEDNADLGPATRTKMLAILQDEQKRAILLLEMAITGKIFVQTTYNLEGDGPLVLECFEKLEAVNRSIQVKHFPNMNAVVARLTNGKPPHAAQQLQQYAENCVQPGFDYYLNRFSGHLGLTVSAFRQHDCSIQVKLVTFVLMPHL